MTHTHYKNAHARKGKTGFFSFTAQSLEHGTAGGGRLEEEMKTTKGKRK